MPFTPAFVDTGKPKPKRYTESSKEVVEAQLLRRYSQSTLKSLVAVDRTLSKRRRHATLARQHRDLCWTFDKVRTLIAEKLLSRVKRPEQTVREAYKLFGVSKGSGIKKNRFKQALYACGLDLTTAEADEIFSRFDVDGSGFLDFEELVKHCMPADYTSKTWQAKRCEAIAEGLTFKVAPDAPNFPRAHEKFRPTVEQHEDQLRRALKARCRRPQDQFRVAYLIFGKPKHGITLPVFVRVLRKLGMHLTTEEATLLMGRYDADGSGQLDFVEFSRGLMGADYTEKTWVAKRGEAIHIKKVAEQLNVGESVVKTHMKAIDDFRSTRKAALALAERERDMTLQAEREQILKRHRRRAARKARRQRATEPGMYHTRAKSAGRTRGGFSGDDFHKGTVGYEHTRSFLPAKFHRHAEGGTAAAAVEAGDVMDINAGAALAHPQTQALALQTQVLAPQTPAQQGDGKSHPSHHHHHQQQPVSHALLHDKIASKYRTVREAFRAIDKDRDHMVDWAEVQGLLRNLNMNPNDPALRRLFERADNNSSGHIDYQEFQTYFGELIQPSHHAHNSQAAKHHLNHGMEARPSSAAACKRRGVQASRRKSASHTLFHDKMTTKYRNIRGAFRAIDKDHDHKVDWAEVQGLLLNFNMNPEDPAMHKLFERADADHDGNVNFQEFKAHFGKLLEPSTNWSRSNSGQNDFASPQPGSRHRARPMTASSSRGSDHRMSPSQRNLRQALQFSKGRRRPRRQRPRTATSIGALVRRGVPRKQVAKHDFGWRG